ncbi:DUF4419 domain-containing protein [Flavobacterium reichenbachii]|uniref:DUF4419 domain-containing protein n=1 Tax=Flavobacterium reichenbachii TaxID=362418 RepID=A0A085ZJM2_9FLAO|nr:DUF4419 domain-containing protein [Flavobacterium reichenbachii]KFF04636.1 hypothetical protein IW19_03405 [Flavobacterium reichenbachii]OXB09831.1 hypothetical protein B0A68_23095 [Flavobacterium reichenbachii]
MKKTYILVLLIAICKLNAQVKIVCDDVKLASDPLPEVSYVKAIETRIGGKFEACELKLRNELFVETEFHPFIASLYIAYADHRRISISPDMIWLLICQGFSTHVNSNAEELRTKFVAFDDKKKLVVNTQPISDDFIKGSINSPWPLAFPVMADSISKYVKSDIHSLYVQSFSTTTSVEKAAYEVALLDVMSGYFEYEYATACGIPEIKIEGTKEDWLKIKRNIKSFKGYNIDNWINSLEPIIQQFINVSDNKIDHKFWSNIFKRKDESGGPYITGWCIKFFPYVTDGEQKMIKNPYIDREPEKFMEGLQTNQFNNGLSKAGFIWNYLGNKYEMEFLAGFVGIKQDKKSLTLRPEIGWLVKDKKNSIETKKPEEIKGKTSKKIEKTAVDWKVYLAGLIGILLVIILFYRLRRRK